MKNSKNQAEQWAEWFQQRMEHSQEISWSAITEEFPGHSIEIIKGGYCLHFIDNSFVLIPEI